jgi:hypothetical protein
MKRSWIVIGLGLALPVLGAPPHVLFSNDTTNLLNCPPPGTELASVPERLIASIEEAAGADVHMLQPGNGWVPWWHSEQYPADGHYRWFQEVAGREPDLIGQFMRDGGDLVAEFIKASRARKVSPYVSLRLNDYHGSEAWDVLRAFSQGHKFTGRLPLGLGVMGSQSRLQLEHTEYQLKPDPAAYLAMTWEQKLAYASNPPTRINLRTARVWDWARPEVPAYKLGFVRELCAGYDIDGLELDFMRWSAFFRLEWIPIAQRQAIMLDFIKNVRTALDLGARPGQRRTLGVRVPSRLSGHDPLGIDLTAWVAAGVDWVNLSCHYISEQQTDLAAVHRLIPNTPLYVELTYASAGRQTGRRTTLGGAEEIGGYRLMTNEQFYTAAHLAYARGGAGVTLFNFVYYRNLGEKPSKPPFEVLARLKDRAWLARQPQHYFLSVSGNPPSQSSQFNRNRRLAPGHTAIFDLDLAPPVDGWRQGGRLRLEAVQPWGEYRLEVRLNGELLVSTQEIAEPYSTRFGPEAREAHLRAWKVPAELLKDGRNRIAVRLIQGKSVEITFLDLSVQ